VFSKMLLNKEPEDDTLAATLRAARAYRGYSQEELSVRAKVNRETIAALEADKRKRGPHRRTLTKIADALGFSAEELMK